MYDLNALLVPGSGWTLQNTNADDDIFGGISINAFGQIALTGTNPNMFGTHVLLLTPAFTRFLRP
jgi:hypothetical protein